MHFSDLLPALRKHPLASAICATAALAAATLAAPAGAVPGGQIGTLKMGVYACETPGDAAGPAYHRVTEQDFTVTNASGYRVGTKTGTYLRTGDDVVMTSGPLRGNRYKHVSDRLLQAVGPDGQQSPLRCIRGAIQPQD